jgi:hypothetical protein
MVKVPKIVLSSLTCSQNWLRPPVDDHESTYLKRLKKTGPDYNFGRERLMEDVVFI